MAVDCSVALEVAEAAPQVLEYAEPAPPESLFRKILSGGGRGFWMLADQGLASVGNFATANLLARYLPPDEYGKYGLILETILFLNSLQAALVNYPMTLEAASRGTPGLKRAATAGALFTLLLLPTLGAVIAIAAHTSGGAVIAASAVIAMVLWQLQETLRRGLIADMRIAACIPGDAISYIGQAVGIFLLNRLGCLTLTTALLTIGGTSGLAILIQAVQIGLARIDGAAVRELGARFWIVGRWMLLTNLTAAITVVSFPWLLRIRWGLKDVAVLQAIAQPLKLANPIVTSMGGLIVPAVARAFSSDGLKASTHAALKYGCFGAVILLPCFAIPFVFPTFALRVTYGANSSYLSAAPLLRIWTVSWVMHYIALVLGSWLLGLHESRLNFVAQVVHMVAALCISLPATALFGLKGLVIGGMMSTTIDVIASATFVVMTHRRRHQP